MVRTGKTRRDGGARGKIREKLEAHLAASRIFT